MCLDIDSAEVSDSTIVERSPLPGVSVASEICEVEADGRIPEENQVSCDQSLNRTRSKVIDAKTYHFQFVGWMTRKRRTKERRKWGKGG